MASELSAVAAAVALIDQLGGWGVGGIFFLFVLAPLLVGIYALRLLVGVLSALKDEIAHSRAETRQIMTEFRQRYKNNMRFVEDYQKLAGELTTVIHLNTEAMTRLVERIPGRSG